MEATSFQNFFKTKLSLKSYFLIKLISCCIIFETNKVIIDQIFTVYRPEKSEIVQAVQIELSINSNSTKSQI